MPATVGIDLTPVDDVAVAIARFGDRYLRRVFTAGEIAYCSAAAPSLAAQRYAARFAAKEAARKALGVGDGGVAWTAIEVCRGAHGAASLRLHGAAAERARLAAVGTLAVSLTHEREYAAAVVAATPDPHAAPLPGATRPTAPDTRPNPPRAAAGAEPMRDRIRELVREHARLAVPAESLRDDADLYEAGMTSHASVGVMVALEEAFGVEFPDRMLRRRTFESVEAIHAALAELVGGATVDA